ncbi:MAG: flagellar assembly protein FliH [Treponema sp.]|jgi:flagellar assembly protein FliH|nr:flagellar assembly protein FliH [Treponema sp.]
MAKAVFRPLEVAILDKKIVLDPPHAYPELAHLVLSENEADEAKAVEEYQGPTADDLRREAEAFKAQWEIERETMIRSAREEADDIIKRADETAFQEVKRKTEEAQTIKQGAEEEAERILEEARQKAREFEAAARSSLEKERRDAEEQGQLAGREAGYQEGSAEVNRLIERTRLVLERAQDKRGEILAETEQQIIDLVLLISRKVIKVISENQRNVVVSNVVQALRKVKGRGNIIIRVNMADVKLTTEHTKNFIQMMEGTNTIQVVEDSSVDSGGCIIETDFGEIDARISSQLAELETRILEISPIKAKAKPASLNEGA